jgi:arylsulfate sulfotransferase
MPACRITRKLAVGLCWLLALSISACDRSDPPPTPVSIVGPPSMVAAASAPMAQMLSVATSRSTTLAVTLDDGAGHRYQIGFPQFALTHDVLLLGMRPNRTYDVSFTVTDTDNQTINRLLGNFVTPPLPDSFPAITLLESAPDQMEPGLTLIEASRKDRSAGFLVIVDNQGRVVWYIESDGSQAVTRLGDDGLLIVLTATDNLIRKIDFAGNEFAAWHAAGSTGGTATSLAIDGASLHHDIVPLPGGTYLTSTRQSIRQVVDFPLDENDSTVTGTVTIREEPVVEFDESGQIVGQWEFLDLLKPTRIGFNATQGQPDATDWVHLNGIWYDASDDSILASLRHQDAVVKYSRANGNLIWILGNHDNWEGFEQFLLTPINAPFTWQYHQHAPMLTRAGTVLLFDNGNLKASPFTGQPPVPPEINFSRAVEYRVDEQLMTIEQVWEYGANQSGELIYTPFIGDADALPETGNVLITFGGICTINGVPSDNIGPCHVSARIIEVDSATNRKVFDIFLDDADPATTGYKVYRSDRIPTLYPLSGATITELL